VSVPGRWVRARFHSTRRARPYTASTKKRSASMRRRSRVLPRT